ncbi:hypothetical protein D3C78_1027110 [compost metagenome]
MDEHLARLGQALEHLEHAAGAALRQVAHGAAELVADACVDHLVVAPQGAVDQQAVGPAHPLQQRAVHLAEAGGVEQLAASADVLDQQAEVVARVRVVAVRRVRRRRAAQRDRREAQRRAGGDGEALVEGDRIPAQAAVPVAEHVEQREAGGQVLVDHLAAPHLVRAALAQGQQAGGVVDLAVQQDQRADRRVAQRAGRLQGRERLDLCADVRRGVADDPVDPVVGQGDGGLGTRLGTQGAFAQAAAVAAVAVPLRETAAGGGTEDTDMHGQFPSGKPRTGRGYVDQRLAKYIVTSKPMRRSVKAGLVHMAQSSCCRNR